MSKKGIPENPFLSFDELIIKLKNKGLIIKQDTKLKWYFVSYNYQNIINSYNKPFLVNDSYKHYIKNANSLNLEIIKGQKVINRKGLFVFLCQDN